MNTEINYIGDYRFGSNSRHREPYWTSRICFNGVEKCVADAAGATENGRNIVRLLPYGPNEHALDGVVQDGDLLSYMQAPPDGGVAGGFESIICGECSQGASFAR